MNSIVVGSGFGGIAAALRLKAKGHQVTLVEKHPDLGGRARVFKKNGFTYDGGPTVITAPYLIDELFKFFAIFMKENAIKEIKDASIKIALNSVKKIITTSVDKSKLDTLFQKNLEETKEELKKINS